ncbi:MAG: DUF1097 domain-containing protein [Candidatus Limnocylindrales bacterium]
METETKETIPLWLAVAITVCVALPFGIWVTNINKDLVNIPIWASFIVWAEYFALGAKPAALKTIVPAFIIGVVAAAIIMTAYALLIAPLGNDPALFVSCFVGFCIAIYAMKYIPVIQVGSLPFFNGISMLLAIYFVGAFPQTLFTTNTNLFPAVAALWAILAGLLGAFLGWFNVTITFPHPVKKTEVTHQPVGV